jgi:hypothetical protein
MLGITFGKQQNYRGQRNLGLEKIALALPAAGLSSNLQRLKEKRDE